MANLESQVEASLEQLQMDERLRSNLTDAEANLLLDWTTTRLTRCITGLEDESVARETIKAETRRVKAALRSINDLFKDDHNPTPSEALTALSLPIDQAAPPLPDRSSSIQWLLTQLASTWKP